MIRIETIVRKALILALPVAAIAIGMPRDARAQYAPPPPPPQYVTPPAPPPPQYVTPPAPPPPQYVAPPAPPDAFIATSTPEYYDGRPVYLYNGNWYYRDEHGWNYYRTEPQYLHDRRAVHEAPPAVHDAPHDLHHEDAHHEPEHHEEQPPQQQRYHYNH